MAEEVQGSVTGGNGERLSLQLGSKSFGLQTRDLIPILLLLAGIVGGYLIFININQALLRLERHHEYIWTVLQHNEKQALDLIHGIQEDLTEHRRQFRQLLQQHDYNSGRDPGERLPLESLPPREQGPDSKP